MTNTIFDQTEDNQSIEDTHSAYEDLVGEGKKFRDNEALARGKRESDQFIESLKRELHETRTELHSRLNMEELVNKLGKTQSTIAPTGVTSEINSIPNPEVMPTKPGLTSEEVSSIVKNTMTQEQTKLAQDRNLSYVAQQLKQSWGDDWVSKLRKVGASLDMTEQQMDTLAKTTPKVLLSSVLKESSKVTNEQFVAPRSSIIGSPTDPTQDKGWAAYEKLRKESPKEYYSARVQLQLHKDVAAGKVIPPSN